jgi:predicted acyl esterase
MRKMDGGRAGGCVGVGAGAPSLNSSRLQDQAAVRGGSGLPLATGAQEVFATMRDGVKLSGNLYLPAGKGPFPAS